MGTGEESAIKVTDKDGYGCRLERWYSDFERKWKVAATCTRPDGSRMFHTASVRCEFSEGGARGQLDLVRNLVPRLEGAKSRFTGLGKGGGPWTRSN